MADKRKSDGGSEQLEKRQRTGQADIDRITRADELQATAKLHLKQTMKISQLAGLLYKADKTLLRRIEEVVKMIQQDDKRAQPLIDLHHELAVSYIQRQICANDEREACG